MKRLLYFLIVTFFMLCLTSCEKLDYDKSVNDAPASQLSFHYSKITLYDEYLVINAYLMNESDIPMYPRSLMLKIYDKKYIYIDDIFIFPDDFYIMGETVQIVTLTFLIHDEINYKNLTDAQFYYEYQFIKTPIEL